MAFMFPWSNFHELNLDWILSVVKEAKEIFVKGAGDIQHAVETADQALETAEQAAAGVIADGAVTIPKVNDEVFNLIAYIVSGSVNAVAIPVGSLVILRKSTVYGVTDGIYVAAADIPASSVITAADLTQPLPLPDAGGLNYVLSKISDTDTAINAIERGLVIVVDGNNATSSVPVGALAYLKNNENGLQEGIYANISNTPYPTTGGTADANVFSAVPNVLNSIKEITGDGVLTGFTATDLTGAANELKTDVNFKADKAELSALTRTGATNAGAQIESGTYFYLEGTLKRATQTIANGSAFTSSNCVTVTVGEELTTLNSGLTNLIKSTTVTGTTDSAGNIAITGLDVLQDYVISVIGNTGYAIGITASGGVYYAKIVGNTNPITPLVNTAITLYIRYI